MPAAVKAVLRVIAITVVLLSTFVPMAVASASRVIGNGPFCSPLRVSVDATALRASLTMRGRVGAPAAQVASVLLAGYDYDRLRSEVEGPLAASQGKLARGDAVIPFGATSVATQIAVLKHGYEAPPRVATSLEFVATKTAGMSSESFLANGAMVRYSGTATAIGDDVNTLTNFGRSTGAAGHDVILHGGIING